MKPALLIGLAAVALSSGCEAGASESPLDDGLLTRSTEGRQDEMTAIVGGTLELDPERGCVLLSGKPVIWPAGTTVSSDPSELHLPDGRAARSGDTITGGGGEVVGARIPETSIEIEGDLSRALECAPPGSKVLVLWTRGGDIRIGTVSDRAVRWHDERVWAAELGRSHRVSDPALVRKVEDAATVSGARAIDVSVRALDSGQHVPVVTLESADPASYLKHRLRDFLDQIGYFEPNGLAFVDLLEEDGRFAWSAGRFLDGGFQHLRPDLDQCSPFHHSQRIEEDPPPPCPAD